MMVLAVVVVVMTMMVTIMVTMMLLLVMMIFTFICGRVGQVHGCSDLEPSRQTESGTVSS